MEKRFMGRAENEEEELIILRLKIYTIYNIYKEAVSGWRVEEKEWSKYVKNVECKTKVVFVLPSWVVVGKYSDNKRHHLNYTVSIFMVHL